MSKYALDRHYCGYDTRRTLDGLISGSFNPEEELEIKKTKMGITWIQRSILLVSLERCYSSH